MGPLRRVLSDYYKGPGRDGPWQVTFPRRGYVPEFMPMAALPEPAPSIRRARLIWISTAALFSIAALVGLRIWTASSSIRSVVVLPFQNLTGDPGQEYLADGITEDLTGSLTHLAGLRVVARTSAFQFKGKAADIRQVGRELGVDAVVERSIRKMDGHLRITVQLNRVRDGYHILSQAFDGGLDDLGRLERDLAAPVQAACGLVPPFPTGMSRAERQWTFSSKRKRYAAREQSRPFTRR